MRLIFDCVLGSSPVCSLRYYTLNNFNKLISLDSPITTKFSHHHKCFGLFEMATVNLPCGLSRTIKWFLTEEIETQL